MSLLLPASIAVLGLKRNILRAMSPLRLFQIVRALGPRCSAYPLIFSVLGGAVYERRDLLGIEGHTSERKAERVRRKELKRSERSIDGAHEPSRLVHMASLGRFSSGGWPLGGSPAA